MSRKGDKVPEHGTAAGKHAREAQPLRSVCTRQQRIAAIARKYENEALTTLSYHLDMLWMREALRRLNKRSVPGVDGQSVEEFTRNEDENLGRLLQQAKDGSYRAPPVKRKHLPKNRTETRPIGIPTTANKVLERAVVMLLEPIYEVDFMDESYGFRPGRSAHQALESIRQWLMKRGGGWIVDVDIRKFFDTMEHSFLRQILRKRVKDKVILRLVGKWLKAGVWENEQVSYNAEGAPQGGVVSPMLSNIYLNEVLDQWFIRTVKASLKGQAHLVRFADDFVILLERQEDAVGVLEQLPGRFGEYGLNIHEEKTQLVDFRRPEKGGGRKPGTFDFLGFTHYWGKTRKGGIAVKKRTSAKKLRRALSGINQWCRKHRHHPMVEQHRKLTQKVQGHFAYYAVTGNAPSLGKFLEQVRKIWRKWLNRRSRNKAMPWDRFNRLIRGPFRLPPPRIIHRPSSQLTMNFSEPMLLRNRMH